MQLWVKEGFFYNTTAKPSEKHSAWFIWVIANTSVAAWWDCQRMVWEGPVLGGTCTWKFESGRDKWRLPIFLSAFFLPFLQFFILCSTSISWCLLCARLCEHGWRTRTPLIREVVWSMGTGLLQLIPQEKVSWISERWLKQVLCKNSEIKTNGKKTNVPTCT